MRGASKFTRALVIAALVATAAARQASSQSAGGSPGGSTEGPGIPPPTGVETLGDMIIDYRNNSITVRTSPSKHREIVKLLELLTRDPLANKNVQVAEFDLMSMTPDQFRSLVRFHKPSLNPNDQRRFYIDSSPDHVGMQTLVPQIPAVSAAIGASTSGGGISGPPAGGS